MFVRSCMSKGCFFVSPKDPLEGVYKSLKEKGFEGLPVQEDGRVVGVVTLGDILERLAGTDRTEAFLKTATVADVMTRQPITISQDEIIEEAAHVMYKNDINLLPVVDTKGDAVGVITQSDFFKIFVEMFGLKRRGTRIALRVRERVGELAKITDVIRRLGVNIISLITFEPGTASADVVVRVETTEPKPVVDALVAAGYRVVQVSQVWA